MQLFLATIYLSGGPKLLLELEFNIVKKLILQSEQMLASEVAAQLMPRPGIWNTRG